MKKPLWILLVVVVVIVAGYFFSHKTSQQNTGAVRIGSFSKAIDYAPYLVAKNQGWFEAAAKKYGMNVQYTEFQSLPPNNEAFATNNIDLVFEAEAPAIVGKAGGIDIKVIGAGAFLTQEIIVSKNSSINSVKGLKGKKVAVLSGTSAHQGLMKVLAANGLTANDVQIIDMAPPDAKAAFETGQVDAWAVWPPFPQQEQVAGKSKDLNGSDIFIQSIVAARGGFIKDQPQLTKDLMGVIRQTQEWIVKNPDQAQQIVAQELGLTLEVVKLSWPLHNFQPTIGQNEIADIQQKADFLYNIHLIKNKVNVGDFIDLQ